jgi:hypothetical protein
LSNTPSTSGDSSLGPLIPSISPGQRAAPSARVPRGAILVPALPYRRQPGQLAAARREIERLNRRVNQLEALNRAFAVKAQELDQLQPHYLALFEAYGNLLRVVQGYNTITASCGNCRHWMDFILASSVSASATMQLPIGPQDQ